MLTTRLSVLFFDILLDVRCSIGIFDCDLVVSIQVDAIYHRRINDDASFTLHSSPLMYTGEDDRRILDVNIHTCQSSSG